MKKIKKIVQILILLISINLPAFSQGDPPPPPPHGSGGAVGGGAPIGGGTFILVALGLGYLVIKLRDERSKNE